MAREGEIRVVPFRSVGLMEFGMDESRARTVEGEMLERHRFSNAPFWMEFPYGEDSLSAVGTCCSYLLDAEGVGKLGFPFECVAGRFSGFGRDCLVRPRSVCSFDTGLTFELHSQDERSSRDYIVRVCAPWSPQLLRWRIYDVVARVGGREEEMAELDGWTDHDEWAIALETAVAIIEERHAPVSGHDARLLRRLGRMMCFEDDFYPWLEEVLSGEPGHIAE